MISVLYVDDESTLLEVTRVYLERTGNFSVKTAISAKQAIALLENESFDAIISDYQMPVMDGLQLLQHLRETNNQVPFILFTGKGREEVAIEALNSGADFYLQKGGEPKSQFAELVNKVQQIVRRRRAERDLALSEEKYRELVENINDVIFAVGFDGSVTYVSPRVRQFGYTAEMIIGRQFTDLVIPEDRQAARQMIDDIQQGLPQTLELRTADAEGTIRVVRVSGSGVITDGEPAGIRGILTDITLQRTAEKKISESEQRYRNVFEAAGDAMLIVDEESDVILDANSAALYLFGFTHSEITSIRHQALLADIPREQRDDRTLISGIPVRYYRSKEGGIIPAEILSTRHSQEKRTISIHSIRNIRDQKDAEERALTAQRLYAVLSRINQAITRVNNLETLVAEICRISVEHGRFRMAWVGLFDKESMHLRPVASAGHEEGYLAALDSSGKPGPGGEPVVGIALHEGRYSVCNDFMAAPAAEPWKDEAIRRGYLSCAAFPFRLHGEVVGAYIVYAPRKNFFSAAEIALLEEIALNISFALDMLDEQARRTYAEQALAGSEERAGFLAEVFELSAQPFAVLDLPKKKFGIVNPAFIELLGYPEQELHALGWEDITPEQYHETIHTLTEELARTGVPQRVEKELIKKDGTRVPVELLLHRALDKGGNPRYFYSFVTDITGRKRAQEALQSERDRAQRYLDTAGVMLAVLDRDGIVTLINRKGCGILGYSEEEITGKDWFATCMPEHLREVTAEAYEAVMNGENELPESQEFTVLTKNGDERTITFHNTLLQDYHGTITGILFSGEDMTERNRMEDALRASEERFKGLIQNSSDMIRIITESGQITYSSPSTKRVTGYDPADVLGKSTFDYVHPDDRDLVRSAFGEVVLRTNTGTPTEYRIRHADGQYIDVEAVAINLTGVPGIEGIVTTTRPITERKSIERTLREREGRYRALYEQSPDAIVITGEQTKECNPAAEDLFGCTRDELLRKWPLELSPPAQPGGRSSPALMEEYRGAAESGSTRVFSWEFWRKDGAPFPARVTLIPADVRGEKLLIAIIHDTTTEAQETQQSRHLSRFLDQDPDPVIEVHRNRDIAYANPACRTILNNLELPADPAAFIPDDFDTLVIAIQSETNPVFYREVQVGTAIFGERLSFDPEKHTIRITAHDVTTQVFERNALERATRKLNTLSGITRHDIKNKLTGVMGYLELAKGSTRDPEMIEYLSRAEISATAVREHIEFTKTYENLGIHPPTWQDFSLVLAKAVKPLERGRIAIEDQTAGLVLYADPMLEKALVCILENAITHGVKATRVRIHGSGVPSGYLIVIEDDGEGVPQDKKEKIFNKKVGTAGEFGLFLTREILSLTGITIQETGEPGAGARFDISVPSGKFQIKSV